MCNKNMYNICFSEDFYMNEILMRAGSLILCIIIILTIIPICSIAAPEDGGRKLYIENPGLEESGGDIAPG